MSAARGNQAAAAAAGNQPEISSTSGEARAVAPGGMKHNCARAPPAGLLAGCLLKSVGEHPKRPTSTSTTAVVATS